MNQDWPRLAARTRGNLDRAALNGRPRRLAEFVIKCTLMKGRTRVVIPKRSDLCRLLKIGANHVQEVVDELESAAILKFADVNDGWEILIFPDCAGWRCKWLYLPAELADYLRVVELTPGQSQGELLEPAPCLGRVLAEVSAENAAASAPALPKMGSRELPVNCEASKKQLNREQLIPTVNQITGKDEAFLLGRISRGIAQFHGPEVSHLDMINYGGNWRVAWVRRYPTELAKALDTLEEEAKTGWQPYNSFGAALKDLTLRYAGAK